MTGFLHPDRLRAHQASWVRLMEVRDTRRPRVRLMATWQRVPGRGLVCSWRGERDAETEPPG